MWPPVAGSVSGSTFKGLTKSGLDQDELTWQTFECANLQDVFPLETGQAM